MTGETSLPALKAVRDLFRDLLGREVDVALCEPLVPGAQEPCTVAAYVDDGLRTAVVVAADLALSAYAGACIGLLPRGGAEACIEDRELSSMVAENLAEVLNVVTALFNQAWQPHVRLYGIHVPGTLPPADLSARLRAVGRRLDVSVTIAGYGTGRLAVVLT